MTTATTAAVIIRLATTADLDRLVEMGQHFQRQTVYHTRVVEDVDHIRRLATSLIERGIVLVADREGVLVGMWAGIVFDHVIANVRMATEVIWWVEPEARGAGVAQRLLAEAEGWGLAQGATRMQLGSWNDRLDRFYVGLGYAPAERIFNKDLV